MAADVYFTAQATAQAAREANTLARAAHSLLTRIDTIRGEIKRLSHSGEAVDALTRSWYGLADARNATIIEWQTLTGQQWETHGENLTRV
jgi:hypothetical protein